MFFLVRVHIGCMEYFLLEFYTLFSWKIFMKLPAYFQLNRILYRKSSFNYCSAILSLCMILRWCFINMFEELYRDAISITVLELRA